MNTFKERNSESDNIRVIMAADKDIVERQVIKQCLPHAVLLICLFHTLRSMRREITAEKLGITAAQRLLSLEKLQKLAYASSDAEYDHLYADFVSVVPSAVASYFSTNCMAWYQE